MIRIRYTLTPTAEATIRKHAQRPAALRQALAVAIRQGAEESAAYLQSRYLRGGRVGEHRGGRLPLAVRSGALLGSIRARSLTSAEATGGVGAEFGSIGPASRYARVILGQGDTTIRPTTARNLWIPVGENLTRSGQPRLSPRAAMALKGPKGGRGLKIFRSKAGNLVAGTKLPVPGSRRKGFKVLFVLKDQITVTGTEALARTARVMSTRKIELLSDAIRKVEEAQP